MLKFAILSLIFLTILRTTECSLGLMLNSSNIVNKTRVHQSLHKEFERFKIDDHGQNYESQNPKQVSFKNQTKCVEDTIELACNSGQRIIVDTITFGKSKTCTHHPWPTGCLRQNYHFHPCTGLQICSVKVPAYDIRLCGLSDYVHMDYRCIEGKMDYLPQNKLIFT